MLLNLGDEPAGILGTGQFLLKCVQSEPIVYTLVQNSSKFPVPLQYLYPVYPLLSRRNRRCKPRRSSSYNYNIIIFHKPSPSSIHYYRFASRLIFPLPGIYPVSYILYLFYIPGIYNASLFVPTTIREFPPDFVTSRISMCRSLARISIVLGEQKPDWQRPIPALVLRFTPSRDFAPRGL